MKENNKVIRGISLTPELWVSIDSVKSPQISRSAFIGMALEEYVKNHYSDKLVAYTAAQKPLHTTSLPSPPPIMPEGFPRV